MGGLTIYRSSAGSGKTFTLVKAYLQLVLANPREYRHVLAVTFTNKATAEMKDRILQNLLQLAKGKGGIMQDTILADADNKNLSTQNLPARAQEALNLLLHDYNHFAVSTIDSFFNKVVRAFARELGLPANFALETEQDRILDEVIDQLMMQYSEDEQLQSWLQQFAIEKMQEGRSWQIKADLKNLGKALFSEQYPLIQESIQRSEGDMKSFLGPLMQQLREQNEKLNDSLVHRCQEILDQVASHGLTSADFAGGNKSSVIKWIKSVHDDSNYYTINKLRTALSGLEGYDNLVSKSKPGKTRQAVFDCADAGLWYALIDLQDWLETAIPRYVTAQAIRENAYPLGVLADLNQFLQAYRSEHEMLLIADLNNLLKAVTGDVESPFIYEKVGNTYKHFLLDEFQDTSDFQWDNLKPLLINALGANYSSLVVGDVKQSIYRWRGGNPDLLVNKLYQDLAPFKAQLKEANLDTNRRSCEHVVRFNNDLFGRLPYHMAEQHGEEGQFITQAYQHVEQHWLPENQGQGYVTVSFLPTQEHSYGDMIEEPLLQTIRDLEERGYKYREIAILVRGNEEARFYAQTLGQAEPQIPVVSSNSLLIGQSPKVQLLVHAMQYLNDPTDTLTRAYLLNDYYLYLHPEESLDHHERFQLALDHEQTLSALPTAFREQRSFLVKLPLYDLGEALLRIFGLVALYDGYLQRFLDVLLDFSKKQQPDLANFLQWWEEEGHQAAVIVPKGEEAVTIETIHKAKGLEFPAVLLPDISFGNSGSGDKWLWETSSVTEYQALPYWPIKFKKSLADSFFSQAYEREEMLSTLDHLNVLYVACTRASDSLHIWAPNPLNKDRAVSQSKLNGQVYEVLRELAPSSFHGGRDQHEVLTWGFPPPEKQVGEAHQSGFLDHQPPSNSWRGKLNIRPKGSDMLKLYEGEVLERINQGILMHGIMARVHHIEDVPQAVEHFYQSGLVSSDEKVALKANVESLINQSGIQEWFTDHDWTVRNEQELLLPNGAAYRPDRVLTKGNQARVMDYKTGEPHASHAKQVREYKTLLERVGYRDIQGYLFYLENGKLEHVA